MAWRGSEWGWEFPVDVPVEAASADSYDGLVLPGGVMSPDTLRADDTALAFVRHFVEAGKPIAAICHGPWVLIDAEGVRGRKLTSYRSLRRDLENAGAEWFDSEVVVDSNLVTSRAPDDLPAFIDATIEVLTKSRETARAGGRS
jgi:protease I